MPGVRFPRFAVPRTPAPPNAAPVSFGTVTVSDIGSTTTVTGSILTKGFATSATPSYTNSTTQSLSLDLAGNLRTAVNNTVTITGSVTVIGGTITGSFGAGGTATNADPSYSEGTTNALSLNLAGYLRTVLSSSSIITANPTTSASVTSSQVTITASATQIFASGASVLFREVTNPTSSNATVFLGAAGVTTANGHYLPGATAFDENNNSAALFGIVATGSVTVSTIGW